MKFCKCSSSLGSAEHEVDAALVVQVDVLGGVAGLAAADAGVEVEPFPGVTTRYLRAEILIVQLFS